MTWNSADAIRMRRLAMGLAQQDVADALGVSKPLLSQVETGKRKPTEEQLRALAQELSLPLDLLTLGTGRLPSDVQAVLDTSAADVAAAVRQRRENEAFTFDTRPQIPPVPKSASVRAGGLGRVPSERINVSKASTSYRAHSYHTKVPPEAIRPMVRAFTQRGDTVLDPFCGSGMTGVAALAEGRNALLSDLAPAAVHIARNYNEPCDPVALDAAFSAVRAMVFPTIEWLYRPVGTPTMVEYTTWSDRFECPACGRPFLYWDAVHNADAIDGDRVTCPKCGVSSRKAALKWVGEVPVRSHTSSGNNRIQTHPPTDAELALIADANSAPIPYWTPQTPFGSDREMWRASHQAMGITHVAAFFTQRNLHALAALRHAIVSTSSGRVREALMFAFTAAVNRASKRYQWNAKRPTNVMTGTLYVSSLRYEWNVWSLFRRKMSDVIRYYESFRPGEARAQVYQRSATDLSCIPTGSVDMVFMDPPFGSNIYYADSSLLWESWLGALTDQRSEIVVNRSRGEDLGGKSVAAYQSLMARSFAETARVLRPGGRSVLAFSNTNDKVWKAIQDALDDAGYETETVHVLNKGQPSIKGVKGVQGLEKVTTLDLMICLRHKKQFVAAVPASAVPVEFIDRVIRESLGQLPASQTARTDEIYSSVLRAAIAANFAVTGITLAAVAERCHALGYADNQGVWSGSIGTPAQSPRFIDGYLAGPQQLPRSQGRVVRRGVIGVARVQGGRNSALYNAHSYHTKVPPESIVPFIEHYTRPGDVVLDPFCGSGMTGVACALTGRRVILNDLSPAAIHLSWNHTQPCDPEALKAGFARVEAAVSEFFSQAYRTLHSDGSPGLVHWTLWSTRHKCPECSHRFLLWDAVDRETGRIGAEISCPGCGSSLVRRGLASLGSEPAWVSYESGEGQRFERHANKEDRKRAAAFQRDAIQQWYPTTRLGPDREMYIRCALQLQGVSGVQDFYTPRNLAALALLWNAIQREPDERVKRALAFAFTNTAWHGTRMRRFNARGGQRPLTGTLYIPQLSSEANVLEVMRHKIRQLARYYTGYRPVSPADVSLTLSSATDLGAVSDASVDYVFTDPPFGSNIFYADCNLIWESWLGTVTSTADEAVVNRSLSQDAGGKSLSVYGSLMSDAMKEIFRVLKPGGWATVVFHNTDSAVWQAIHDAAESAGFSFHEASTLERRQQSHKGYKGRSGSEDVAHFDVIFNLRKSAAVDRRPAADRKPVLPKDMAKLVADIVQDAEVAAKGLQGVHAELMRRLASQGSTTYVDYAEVRKLWEHVIA